MSQETVPIGHVVSVSGSKVRAILDGGERADAVSPLEAQVGSLVRLETPGSIAYGLISSLWTDEPKSPPDPEERRFFELELLGEALHDPAGGARLPFQRGVSVYPQLGAIVHSACPDDLSQVYARPKQSTVRVGSLHQDRTLPAFVTTDDLLGKHFAVLGTSGSGKSCSVALILRAILSQHPQGHVVLLDPHNEYHAAFGTNAEVIDPNSLELPYWMLNFEETCEVLIGRDARKRETEIGILKTAILDAKRRYFGEGGAEYNVTVDTPCPYRLASVSQSLDNAMGRLDRAEGAVPYLRLKTKIDQLTSDSRFDFMFSGMFVSDNMPEIVSRILRVPVGGKPITIMDLSGVPSEIVEVVVSMLCRIIFDYALWSEIPQSLPVLVVCEEAHRYVPRDDLDDFGATKKSVARIAKEGRKYGVSLGLITQRPSELSASVLSQCSTLFALRMSNQTDQECVGRALPDSAAGFLASLPSLRTQEAIVVGEGVTVPVRLRFDDLDAAYRPRSGTATFSTVWQEEVADAAIISKTIERWRRQAR